MSSATPAEPTPALVLLQPPPITHNLAFDTRLPMPPQTAAQASAPAHTRTRITTKLSDSGKKRAFTVKVSTHSGWTPTGAVTFTNGLKILRAEAPLDHGITTIKVEEGDVNGVVTAIYSGDHLHATSSETVELTADSLKAKPSAPVDSGLPMPERDDHEGVASGIVTSGDDQKETALASEIAELWHSEQTKSTLISRSSKQISLNRTERAKLRLSLGERLDEYKRLLVRAGRDGKWMEFLREANIPKTTAERYVEKWKLSKMSKPENRTTGTIDEPSNENIAALVKAVKLKADRVLTTPKSVAQFLTGLAAALQPPVPAA